MPDQPTIAYAKIHPAIGIARVGNSPTEYFIGPEVPHPKPKELGFYRDANGFIKRQAARFRIFGYSAAGEVITEITADEAEIAWKVEVANTKPGWYNFDTAMDLPEAIEVPLRNRAFTGEERKKLRIEPGWRSISGKNQKGVKFDSGAFCDIPVYLGELETDDAGRLIFLGGRGRSGSAFGQKTPSSFDNNDGWYDDVSDGPVSAEVVMNGVSIPVESAWVATVPPNFSPDLSTFPTMYDIIYEVMINGGVGWIEAPDMPDFMEHIYPIFKTLTTMQWVNQAYLAHFGFEAPFDFESDLLFKKLADPTDENKEFRKLILQYFRSPSAASSTSLEWPWITGDTWLLPGSPNAFLSVTALQYQFLTQWAEGQFTCDNLNPPSTHSSLEEIDMPLRPAELDKAALVFLSGGPFHPGVDLSWHLRHYTVYDGLFRIRNANGQPSPEYGPTLKPSDVISMFVEGIPIPNNAGPLNGQKAGDLTKWLSIPWHLELVACSPGVLPGADPYLPAFWPARIPDNVLSSRELDIIKDPGVSSDSKRKAFLNRRRWSRTIPGLWMQQAAEIPESFYHLGIIQLVTEIGVNGFPNSMYVETPPLVESDESIDQGSADFEKLYLKSLQQLRKKIRQ